MKHIPMVEFKMGRLVQCVAAPVGCESYVGREGLVYPASEAHHGPGATWIWNMRFSGGAAEVPIRGYETWLFAEPGGLEFKR